MNRNGYYTAPSFQQNQINQMTATYQPMGNMNTYGGTSFGIFS